MLRTKPVPITYRRHSRMKWCEVVRVDSPILLINSRQHACHYETTDGEPLVVGYYLALWPAGACRSFYGRELWYLGPFATKTATQLLQTSALTLGIVDPDAESDHTDILVPPASSHWQQPDPTASLVQVAPGEAPVIKVLRWRRHAASWN